MKSEDTPFLPHGGYRNLRSYKVAEAVYDATVVFCRRFFPRDRRMTDQMVQAARSGVRNIAEGSGAGATSRKSEMKLTNVARASLNDELLRDYESFLRQHGLRVWAKESDQSLAMRERLRHDKVENLPPPPPGGVRLTGLGGLADFVERADPELAANAMVCAVNQAAFLLRRQLDSQGRAFLKKGGFSENLYRRRSEACRPTRSDKSDESDPSDTAPSDSSDLSDLSDVETPTPSPTHHIARAMGKVTNKRDLAALFRYLGIRASRNLGQNFLVDHNLLDFIVRTGDVGPDDLVVDIGCGTGLLTAHLADAAGYVIGVEVDRRMYGIASRYLEDRPNVELLRTDALAGKHRMHPTVMEAIGRAWDSGRYSSVRMVSNLPYSVASLIVPNMLESDLPLACLVVMVQREVADRMVAGPGSSAYGSLSLTVQVHANATLVRTVPPAVFWPRPRVESAIVKLVPCDGHMGELTDYRTFVETVRGAFTHRRKKLANALASSHRLGDHEAIVEALAACDIAPGDRAEHVGLPQYIQLANRLHQEQPCPP